MLNKTLNSMLNINKHKPNDKQNQTKCFPFMLKHKQND